MKKNSLLMLLPFALLVTGCSGKLEKGNLFNAKFMKQNFDSERKAVKYEYQAPTKIDLNLGEGVTVVKNMASSDILDVSKDGKKARFSLATNSFAIPLSAELTSLDSVITSTPIRIYSGTKTVEEKTVTMVFDDWGNKLYEGPATGPKAASKTEISRLLANGNEYLRINIIIGASVEAYAYYDVNNNFIRAITAKEFYEENPFDKYGERMVDEGHQDYYYKKADYGSNYRYSVFNSKKGKYVASFVVPKDSTYITSHQIGDHIVYQIENLLPKRAEKFDFSSGENKYSVETYSVDMLTGKEKSLKTNLRLRSILDSKAQKDEKGINKYLFVEQIQEITEDKILGSVERDLILDENLKVCADVTGINYAGLQKFDNDGHYISDNNFIYDEKLKEVGFMPNPVGDNVVRVNGKYTIVDYTGKHLVPAVYDKIDLVAEENYYIFETDEAWKFGNLSENGTVNFVKEISKEEYEEYPASPKQGNFDKFKVLKRKSDSEKVMFDVITGDSLEVVKPLEGSTNVALMNDNYYDYYERLDETIKYNVNVYSKDDAYYAICYSTKIIYELPSMKK